MAQTTAELTDRELCFKLWQALELSKEPYLVIFHATWEGVGIIVDQMRERGWGFNFQSYSRRSYMATFYKRAPSPRMSAEALDTSAPRATALAALRAIEADKS